MSNSTVQFVTRMKLRELSGVLSQIGDNIYQSPWLRREARRFAANELLVKELSDALTILIAELHTWDWPEEALTVRALWTRNKWRLYLIARGKEVSGGKQEGLDPYWRWILCTYGPEILKRFGSFRFLITELVLLQLIGRQLLHDSSLTDSANSTSESTVQEDDISF